MFLAGKQNLDAFGLVAGAFVDAGENPLEEPRRVVCRRLLPSFEAIGSTGDELWAGQWHFDASGLVARRYDDVGKIPSAET